MPGHYSVARLRHGVVHFLAGKVGSALLTFCGFLLVARLLQPTDYGRYVTLIALVELGMNLASLGLDWVSTRYVPEYRVKAGGPALARFVARLVAVQAVALAAAATMLAIAAPWIAALLNLGDVVPALRLYALYLLLEGLCRVLRDQMLGQLLLQGRAQAALLLRHAVWVGLALVLWQRDGAASLWAVALIEVAAAVVGLLAASAGLAHALHSASKETPSTAIAPWTEPTVADMRRLAVNSYVGLLLNIPARPQVVTLLVTRLAGLDAAALYGFARSLADQVLRFLPAELLLGFVRPAMVAHYVNGGRFQTLNQQTNTLLVVSLLVLAPLLALVIGCGEAVVHVLGAGRFGGSGVLLALMLVAAALFSHRRMLEFVANTVGQPQVVGQASVLLLGVPVAVLSLLDANLPVWSVPAVVLCFEALFSVSGILLLRRAGIGYAPPVGQAVRVALAVALSATVLAMLAGPVETVWRVALLGLGALLMTGLLAWAVQALGPADREMLKSMTRKKGASP